MLILNFDILKRMTGLMLLLTVLNDELLKKHSIIW
jgi:hypothetical protein